MYKNVEKISNNALAGFCILMFTPLLCLFLPASWVSYAHTGAFFVAGFSFGRQLAWRLS